MLHNSIINNSIVSMNAHLCVTDAMASFVLNNSGLSFSSAFSAGAANPLLSYGARVAQSKELTRTWHAAAASIELRSEIRSFSSLSEDWDGEGALPIAMEAIESAIGFVEKMAGSMSLPIAYPNPNGTITLAWRWRSGRAELEIGKTRHSWLVIDRSGIEPKRTSCSGDNQLVPLLGMPDLWSAISSSNSSSDTKTISGLAMRHEWAEAA